MGIEWSPYLPFVFAFAVAFGIATLASALSLILGPRKPNPAKLNVYECGVPVVGNTKQRFSVKFYLTAILFILFDIETIFLYLWAVAFDQLKWFGVIEVGLFVGTLIVGYIYVLKRGALRWE